ncbi:putative terminase large subunit [Erwinia phage KEY]|uniref:Terminase large subunit n=2 Tax=Keyvirus TaxID=3152642 RepID=A0AAE8BFZ4_9CAUD|nr:terminase large subunit [Pantoea phage vB_PagS_AAS21]QYC51493.1 putative terminase large subunit [Erwinia phage KEY]
MQISKDYIRTKDVVNFPIAERFFKLPVENLMEQEGITPNEPQVAIINALNDPRHRFITACVSRRVGKSFIAYTLGFLKLLEPNVKVLVVAPNYSLANIGWGHIKGLVKKYGLETVRENAKDKEIELANGSLFKLASAAQADSAVGRSYDFIIFDEAAISDKGGDAFEIQLRPTLDKPNSKALFISTPRGGNWFKQFYERGFRDDLRNWVSIHGTYRDNPRVSLADIEEARKTVSKNYFKQEYEADFSVFEGQIYDTFRIDKNVADLRGMKHFFANDSEFETLMGIDVGYRDPTAILTIKYHYDLDIYYVMEEYQQAEKTTSQHALYIQHAIDRYNVDRIFVDSAAAQFRQDLAYEHEIASAPAKKSVLDGIACLQALFQQDKIIVDASCTSLIHALANYKWEIDEENTKISREKPYHDASSHLADALRYGIYSISRGK